MSGAPELAGRTALVVGGGSGIGRASALALARHGAAIAVADLDLAAAAAVAAEIEATGASACALPVDVTDLASVEEAHRTAMTRLGPVDILINSAGANERGNSGHAVAEIDLERWDAILRLNLYGTLHCCRVAARSMIGRGWGRIVNIGSAAGYRLEAGGGAYAVSKAAIPALTKILAKEVGRHGVTANVVVPFFTDTPMLRRRFPDRQSMDAALQSGALASPMGVVLDAEDQAAAVLYLCLESGRYVTGQSIHVNGGSWMP
ncbi:NAD(P)-dependent oxidoreductase [Rhizorhabdus dicambivorans]|uniref:SDR family NAD(P)-dependent oxidoreductase n=1 Tax=Rhizorhabdus dicambivorans TaxID=1850238 RepID=UPI00082A62D7|nr:SDR family NAD(P)-dependent oxidoreductase [Rhizorhabdus dicambivorans]ATE66410.1 NAD(P)-dependent oxidoreductase [Rhizorhabdus dicambivorans]